MLEFNYGMMGFCKRSHFLMRGLCLMARRRRSKSTGGLVVLDALFAIGFIIVF